jgi:hypothetical protein
VVVVLAVPALVAVVVAFAALVMAWFRPQGLQGVIDQFLRGVPIVGGQIADAARSIASALGGWIASWIDGLVQPLVDVLDFSVGWARAGVQGATRVLGWLYATVAGLHAAITLGLAAASSTAGRLALSLQAEAAQVAGMALRLAATASLVSTIIAVRIPAAILTAATTAERVAAGALAAAVSSLQAFMLAQVAGLAHLLGQEALAREAADAAVRAAAAAQASEVARAAAAALAAERAFVGAEVGTIGQAIDGVQAKIGEWAVPATIAATITATIAEVEQLRRCNDPMCSYLTPQLGALQAIEDVALLAAIAELVHEAAHNPAAAARDTIATADPIIGAVRGILGDLAGIQV